MSVVAVKKYKDRIEIAADSQFTCGDICRNYDSFKLKKINNDLVVGGCGTARTIGLLWIYFETHSLESDSNERTMMNFMLDFCKWQAEYNNIDPFDSKFIIVYKNKIFEILGYEIIEIKDYTAIGSGYESALAALYLGHSPKEAVKVACELNCYVGEPIQEEIIKFNLKK